MSVAVARIHARLIHKGIETIYDIQPEHREIVKEQYYILFDEPLQEEEDYGITV